MALSSRSGSAVAFSQRKFDLCHSEEIGDEGALSLLSAYLYSLDSTLFHPDYRVSQK